MKSLTHDIFYDSRNVFEPKSPFLYSKYTSKFNCHKIIALRLKHLESEPSVTTVNRKSSSEVEVAA